MLSADCRWRRRYGGWREEKGKLVIWGGEKDDWGDIPGSLDSSKSPLKFRLMNLEWDQLACTDFFFPPSSRIYLPECRCRLGEELDLTWSRINYLGIIKQNRGKELGNYDKGQMESTLGKWRRKGISGGMQIKKLAGWIIWGIVPLCKPRAGIFLFFSQNTLKCKWLVNGI